MERAGAIGLELWIEIKPVWIRRVWCQLAFRGGSGQWSGGSGVVAACNEYYHERRNHRRRVLFQRFSVGKLPHALLSDQITVTVAIVGTETIEF